MLGRWQADGSDVVRVCDRTVQLHQGDVIVKGERVVIWVRNDPSQVPLHDVTRCLPLDVKAEVSLPSAGLRISEDEHNKTGLFLFFFLDNKKKNKKKTRHIM